MWFLGASTSKLNDLSPWSPNGPVPIVRVIAVPPLCRSRSENTAGASAPSDVYSIRSAINVAAPVRPIFGFKVVHTAVTMLIAGYEAPTSGLEPLTLSHYELGEIRSPPFTIAQKSA